MAEAHTPVRRTPLYALHCELGGKLVPFAGYELPVQYPTGILAEHLHTRAAASLFDVSHMGQVEVIGEEAARWLEVMLPGDIQGLQPGQTRYALLLNEVGGTIDDLLVSRPADDRDGSKLFLVFNAARKAVDVPYLKTRLGPAVRVELLDDRALLALQGPQAAAVMARHAPDSARLTFLTQAPMSVAGIACRVSRSGYTGEDGFEISVPAGDAEGLARLLLAAPEVKPAGLGARDSLRLEAGLCLYGHELDETISPIEAGLAWVIPTRRRAARDFPGHSRILRQIEEGPPRKRVGLKVEGRQPVRDGAEITSESGSVVGRVTSGGFAPSLNAPIAMGYVASPFAKLGTKLFATVRGKAQPVSVTRLPFVPTRYHK
ncbi:MAG TPA: glycine cleavage system aminomethyltransferase GcvT [Kiloniellales bacterium]|nr:glycine cleavage system aminomethyltransferase GcvT [Kiloniellales bacterium]